MGFCCLVVLWKGFYESWVVVMVCYLLDFDVYNKKNLNVIIYVNLICIESCFFFFNKGVLFFFI